MTSVWGSSFVSPPGGASTLLLSSKGEQHMLPAQAFPQARLQASGGGRDGSSLWTSGEASPPSLPAEDAEQQEANSGWTVQQVTPTLFNTLVTPDIRSAHLDTNDYAWINISF